jgi:DNA-binding SARP family transcriptional activator
MADVSTLPSVELEVLGPLQVRLDGRPVAIPGAKPRAILTMLGLHGGSVVSADTLIELLWGEAPPRTSAKALQTHISSLRRALGDGYVLTKGAGWTLAENEVDATHYKSAAQMARAAAAAGETGQAAARFEEALTLWRGIPELPDEPRGISEKTRWSESNAALVEDRADALLASGRAAEVIGDLEAAVAEAPLRERRWGQLMLALYRAGRQGEALAAYQRARALLVDQLGVDPGPELRRLEAAIVAQDPSLDLPVAQAFSVVTLRGLRRGRPRRRTRKVRRIAFQGATTGKCGKPSGSTRMGLLRDSRLGRDGRDNDRRLFHI